MAKASRIDGVNKSMLYTFRFAASDKLVHLTQLQLNSIPYLAKLVAHKDDLSSSQNENGEYVLHYPIDYTCFMAILRSVTSKQPYELFRRLPERSNICDAIELMDYLCIDPFLLPILKDTSLVLFNPTELSNDEMRIVYHRANLSEVRETAAEFIIALARNIYDLNNVNTIDEIFTLIKIILSNRAVFSSRFRHHSIMVAKQRYYRFLSKTKFHQLPTPCMLAKERKRDILIYNRTYNLPDKFFNAFSWRSTSVPKEDNQVNPLWNEAKNKTILTPFFSQRLAENLMEGFRWTHSHFEQLYADIVQIHWIDDINVFGRQAAFLHPYHIADTISYEEVQIQKTNEAKAARAGHFNTLPRRPTVDKFKHRVGPKAQKYR